MKSCVETIDIYQISLFFVKRGEILFLRSKSGELSIPTSIAPWSQSPEECACDLARKLLNIRIDQFDYPLGFQQVTIADGQVTSYSLLPSMWKERDTDLLIADSDFEWLYPLKAISQMTDQAKDVMRRYYSRIENDITFGRYCS